MLKERLCQICATQAYTKFCCASCEELAREYVQAARDEYGVAVRDNSEEELILIGHDIVEGIYE